MTAAAPVERLAAHLRRARSAVTAVLLCVVVTAEKLSAAESKGVDSRSVTDTVTCLDTLARDSILVLVKMSVKPQEKKVTLPADFEGYFVQEFRSLLKVPS